MSKPINNTLLPLHGYLLSIERDVDSSSYIINMGIPSRWTYKDTNVIECEVVASNDTGTLLKIYGKNDKIVLDDLIDFCKIIVDTNERLQKMQEEFDKKMIEMKEKLVQEQRSFLDELDEMKDKSFHEIEEKVNAHSAELESEIKESETPKEVVENLNSI